MYILTKIKMADPNAIRGNEDSIKLNWCSELVVGEPAVLLGPPVDDGMSIRMIRTSTVLEITVLDTCTTRIQTESGSTYDITEIGDDTTIF